MAWQFNGNTDYAILADAPALTLATPTWSIGGWFRVHSNAGNGNQMLLSCNSLMANRTISVYWPETDAAGPGKIAWFLADAAGYTRTATSTGAYGEVVNAWMHWLLVHEGSRIAQYVNGNLDGTASAGTLATIDPYTPLYFACRNDGASSRAFCGSLAEWGKWNRALSEGEIAALVRGATPDRLAAGLGWYLPMRDKPIELVCKIPTTLIGARAGNHPRIFRPSPTSWAARAQGVAP